MEKKISGVLVTLAILSIINMIILAIPVVSLYLKIEYLPAGYYFSYKVVYSSLTGGYIETVINGKTTVDPLVPTLETVCLSLIYLLLNLLILILALMPLLQKISPNNPISKLVEKYEVYYELILLVLAVALNIFLVLLMLNYDKSTFIVDGKIVTLAELKGTLVSYYKSSPYFKFIQPEVMLFFSYRAWLMAIVSLLIFIVALYNLLRNSLSYSTKWSILPGISGVILFAIFLPWVEFFELDTKSIVIANAFIYVVQNYPPTRIAIKPIDYGIILLLLAIVNFVSSLLIGKYQILANKLFIEIMRSELTREELEKKYQEVEFLLKRQRIFKTAYLSTIALILVFSVMIIYGFMGVYRVLDSRLFQIYFMPVAGTWLGAWIPWLFSLVLLILWSIMRE